jgi:hypothetical protein
MMEVVATVTNPRLSTSFLRPSRGILSLHYHSPGLRPTSTVDLTSSWVSKRMLVLADILLPQHDLNSIRTSSGSADLEQAKLQGNRLHVRSPGRYLMDDYIGGLPARTVALGN